jgi:hypothetical protein
VVVVSEPATETAGRSPSAQPEHRSPGKPGSDAVAFILFVRQVQGELGRTRLASEPWPRQRVTTSTSARLGFLLSSSHPRKIYNTMSGYYVEERRVLNSRKYLTMLSD